MRQAPATKPSSARRERRADLAGLSTWWTETRGQPFEPALLAERDLHTWVRQRQVEDGASPATLNRAISTGRRCWAWLLAQGLARENPLLSIKAVAQDPPAPRKLDRAAVGALLRAAAQKEPRLDQAAQLLAWADDLETASPHALRHSLACGLLEGGASLAAVQRIMRHSRAEQTLRYATPSDRDLKDVNARSGGV